MRHKKAVPMAGSRKRVVRWGEKKKRGGRGAEIGCD